MYKLNIIPTDTCASDSITKAIHTVQSGLASEADNVSVTSTGLIITLSSHKSAPFIVERVRRLSCGMLEAR